MLRSFSNPYLTPDDFSVPCRLRRCEESSSCGDSDNDTTKQQQHAEEMTCTMRKWHKETNTASFTSPLRRDSSNSRTKKDDAELIFVPCGRHNFLRRRCMSGEISKDMNTPIPLSKRFASFGTPARIDPADQLQYEDAGSDVLSQSVHEPQFKDGKTIPVKDIIKVLTRSEVDGKPKSTRKRSSSVSKKENSLKEECRQPPSICITTHSESYELIMESTNEQLVLLTFLKANSTNGQVVFVQETEAQTSNAKIDNPQTEKSGVNKTVGESTQKERKEETNLNEEYDNLAIQPNPSTLTEQSTGERSFDVEALTAITMAERMQKESLTEKLERRLHRIVSSLDDLSKTFAKCACGCLGDSIVDHAVLIEKDDAPRRRKNTESTVASDHDKLEVDPGISTEETSAVLDLAPETPVGKTRNELLTSSRMPSGLSVEPEEDFLVDTVPFRVTHMITCDI